VKDPASVPAETLRQIAVIEETVTRFPFASNDWTVTVTLVPPFGMTQ
jgi:hypothetical protein